MDQAISSEEETKRHHHTDDAISRVGRIHRCNIIRLQEYTYKAMMSKFEYSEYRHFALHVEIACMNDRKLLLSRAAS